MIDSAAALAVRDVPVASLRPWERNPRRISSERLAALARALATEPEMMWARPLIALPDGTVIAGNQRLAAAVELGWETVPTVVVDLDAARSAEWALRDNRAYGEDVNEQVSVLLSELQQLGRDIELTGFDVGELDRLLAGEHRGAIDPDEAPAPPARPRSKAGEVYELGPHRLACGDVADPDVWDALLGGVTVDVCVTDPPYGVDYQGGAQGFSAKTGKRRVRRIDGDKSAELYALALPHIYRSLRPDGALYFWFSDSRSREVLTTLKESGFQQRAVIVWVKDVPTGALTAHYIPRHEPMVYASRGGSAPRWFGPTNEVTIWEHPKPRVNELHPTQKPVALYERALRNSSRRGEALLDPFAGSGTALIAAEQMGRVAYLMELDPVFCDVIRDRYAAFTGAA